MSQDIRTKIAKKVKEYRIKSKLTKEELSLKLGLDNSYISKLENERINISVERLNKIAEFFKADITDFLR